MLDNQLFTHFMPIADYQVFTALFLALATGIFAVRLGVALYK
jgi:photosystem I reaction center subunit XII